jgi:hypothetical protein
MVQLFNNDFRQRNTLWPQELGEAPAIAGRLCSAAIRITTGARSLNAASNT